jgi:surface polysaccharide O-acyltransferase-like enzyme
MIWMDHLRGVAIILVIAFHAATVMSRFGTELPATLWDILDFFAPFRMPTLMFLSGMLLTRSLQKDSKSYWLGKVRGIAWPYLLWSLVFLTLAGQLELKTPVAILLVPPTYLWYLWFLLAFYAIVWVYNRWYLRWWILLAAAAVGSLGPDTFRFSRFCFLLIFFIGGHLYMSKQSAIDKALGKKFVLPVASLLALASGIANVVGLPVQYNVLYLIAPLSAIVFCVKVIPLMLASRFSSILAYIGENSIVFYVSHFTILWVLGKLLSDIGLKQGMTLYAIGVSAALVAGIALTYGRKRTKVLAALFQFPSISIGARGRHVSYAADASPTPSAERD